MSNEAVFAAALLHCTAAMAAELDAAGEAIRADAGAAGVYDAEWLPKSEVRRRIARAASVLSGAASRWR